MDLITDESKSAYGRVKCLTKHLSTFGVSYLPIDLS